MKTKLSLLAISFSVLLFSCQPQQKDTRYRFETEKINTEGKCPDSIKASIYDSKTKKVLHYSFNNDAMTSKEGFYYTLKASEKGSLTTGQVMDCSMKTIAVISVSSIGNKEKLIVNLNK